METLLHRIRWALNFIQKNQSEENPTLIKRLSYLDKLEKYNMHVEEKRDLMEAISNNQQNRTVGLIGSRGIGYGINVLPYLMTNEARSMKSASKEISVAVPRTALKNNYDSSRLFQIDAEFGLDLVSLPKNKMDLVKNFIAQTAKEISYLYGRASPNTFKDDPELIRDYLPSTFTEWVDAFRLSEGPVRLLEKEEQKRNLIKQQEWWNRVWDSFWEAGEKMWDSGRKTRSKRIRCKKSQKNHKKR